MLRRRVSPESIERKKCFNHRFESNCTDGIIKHEAPGELHKSEINPKLSES